MTWWEWHTEKQYLHDLIASDRRYPTVNAYGPLFGSPEYSTDLMPMLDPKTHQVTTFKMPVRDPNMPATLGPGQASSRWRLRPTGATSRSGTPGPTTTTACSTSRGESGSRPPCAAWTTRTFARRAPTILPPRCSRSTARRVRSTRLDPKTMQYTFIDTCFGTHHPQFGYDANDTLWLSGTGQVAGWVNTKMFDATGDAAQSQGLVPVHPRYQRQWEARRDTSSRTSRPSRPRTNGLPRFGALLP